MIKGDLDQSVNITQRIVYSTKFIARSIRTLLYEVYMKLLLFTYNANMYTLR